MEKTKFRTSDLNQASALWAQEEFRVEFDSAEPTERAGWYTIVFQVHTSQEKLDDFLNRYVNEQTLIEPRKYDRRLNSLRDQIKRGARHG